jgi:tetratricopeptide (TPR) repeat protein
MATLEGRFDEAERRLAAALRSGERAYGSHAVVTSHFHLYALRHQQGGLEGLEETIRRSADEFPSYRVLRCLLAHLYAELRREDEARREFEALAQHDFESLPRNDEWVFGMSLLADVASFLVDAIRAETIYRLLLPHATWSAVSAPDACVGAVARSLGVAAATAGRPDDAERHFEEALKMNARMGARPWLARTQYDYAVALVGREPPGDRERAAELVGAAVTSARDLCIPYLIERAETLQRSVGPQSIR